MTSLKQNDVSPHDNNGEGNFELDLQDMVSENGKSAAHSIDTNVAMETSQEEFNSIGSCSINMAATRWAPSAPYKRLVHATESNSLFNFCSGFMFLICSLIIFVPAFILVIILFPLCWLGRRIWLCCSCISTRSCDDCQSTRVSALDAFWLHDTSLNRSIIQCLFDLEGGLDLCRIRDLVMARLVCAENKHKRREYPRFTQKVVPTASGYVWKTDDSFAINNHILPMPPSIQTREELAQYIGQLASRGLVKERPLWEMHVLTNFGETKDTMVLLRIHPCLADGMSLLRLFYNLVDDTSGVYIKPTFGRASMMFNIVRAFLIGPFVLLTTLMCSREKKNILHGPDLSGRKVIAWSEPFDFTRAYRSKQVTRSKLNDILLSAISGSLRSYMQAKGVGNPYDCHASLHIDLRPSNESMTVLDNHFVYTNITLPTNTEGAIPRLWEVKHRMDNVKNSSDYTVLYGSHFILSTILPFRWYQRLCRNLLNKSSTVIANLPGPDVTLRFGSREIKGMVHWLPARNSVPLSICVASYGDQIRLSVMADSAVVPDPEIITCDFIAQMTRLSELLAHRRIPGEHSLRTRISIPTLEGGVVAARESSVEELHDKMMEVQQQLQEVKQELDTHIQAVQNSPDHQESNAEASQQTIAPADHQRLVTKVETLKEEFRDLLAELRRQKAAEGATLLSDDEEDEEIEARNMYLRKRSHSETSRRSLASIHARSTHVLAHSPGTSGKYSHVSVNHGNTSGNNSNAFGMFSSNCENNTNGGNENVELHRQCSEQQNVECQLNNVNPSSNYDEENTVSSEQDDTVFIESKKHTYDREESIDLNATDNHSPKRDSKATDISGNVTISGIKGGGVEKPSVCFTMSNSSAQSQIRHSTIVSGVGKDSVHSFVKVSTASSSVLVEHVLMHDTGLTLHEQDEYNMSPPVERKTPNQV